MTSLLSRTILLLGAAAALSACGGSPTARYYTLLAPQQKAVAPAGTASYMVEVLPVIVPAQADQPQIMLRTGAGTVAPLYSDRWTAALGDELRAALSDGLTRELGVLDVQVVRPGPGAPVWRVQTDVQRFDMNDGGPAVLDVTWRARPLNTAGRGLVCRTVVSVPQEGSGITGLITAQQQATQLLARTIASAIQSGGERAQAPGEQVSVSGCTQLGDAGAK
ncbi:PqiC family protein [Bordetella genomosp. 1]|uniref:ABC-type transport auxiliary lipoprotein component domain-containing protein n=1 Tax=Bordetella genomosp. 1 TaxID=1395607 RepID=A0ABX4F2J8_9BORD|nr:PqiC family protein [Bordetella genomosp. 1]OZI65904.1 hypothetical protein CAL27_13010 [Bordetella genomosp. 1]